MKGTTSASNTARLRTWRRWLVVYKSYGLAVVLAVLLLPYLALCFYNQPYWDDYGNAALARDRGWWPTLGHLYKTWTGRYTAGLWLTLLNPLTYGWEAGIRWFALALFMATGAVQAFALRTLTRDRLGWGAALVWSGVWLLGQLYTMPSVNSGFYWFASTVTYQVATLLLVLVPVACLRAGRAVGSWTPASWYALAVAAAVGVAGSNEVALILLLWLLTILTIRTWLHSPARAGDRHRWLGLLLVTLVAGAVAVLAPGNSARLVYEGKGVSPGAIGMVAQACKFTLIFLSEPRQLTALVVAPVLVGGLGFRLRPWRPAGLRLPLPLGIGIVLIGLWGAFLLLSRTTGYPAVRTLNPLWFWLLSGWLLALWAALPDGPSLQEAQWRRCFVLLRAPVLVYVALLSVGGVERAAWNEWLWNASSWKAQLEARSRVIHAARARGQRAVIVEGIQILTPRYVLVLGEPLSDNPGSDLNRAVADWYQVDSLWVQRPYLKEFDLNR
ncbi:hypothetical protein SAMN00120144_4006 [Hymenobacter roseosalivarius DSM 11622]|uniref:Glycosyltransferase RgtA/B/C/D-like domain-containing protein n=1 Tax=Hymenobacter roseosalivarius DSM 11622 TaxID=645990 RepID=A0A1W1UHN2_9BACT|nr:hypothetical protein [Hymenobacter roseosalivarius]SMB80549.1 hypothetical protein SAMN00120144_4006 [Hymenobacter roseosalivarius DSM 11622]